MDFLAEAEALEPEMIKTRRHLHQRPELSFEEKETAKFVASRLEALGVKVRTGVGGNGVVGTLAGGRRGKVVALRADMDALPVQESTGEEFSSKVPGVMHACGHDTHMAALLGAAKILSAHRKELKGTVRFIFQPAEEHGGRGGALPMMEDGALEGPKVDFVFGLHIVTNCRSGEFGVRPGAAMAATDIFTIRVKGKGGHGARPHESVDPVYMAAQVITALQGVSGRMVDPVKPFVISVCSVHGGTKDNIIPDEAVLEGTMRTLDEGTRKVAKAKVKEVAAGICKAMGGTAEVEFMEGTYPVTFNHPETARAVAKVLAKLPGVKVKEPDPVLWGEDFSRYMLKVPGTFYFLGSYNEAKGCVHPNHSAKFKADEDVLKLGAASLALLAFEFGDPGRS